MKALNFLYLHAQHIGYGYQGTQTHKALERLGVKVYDDPSDPAQRNTLFLSLPTHVPGWWNNQRAHLFTMWEGTDLPELMRESLHNFDTLIVPSQHCVDLFGKYHDNVHFAPLGVDVSRWEFRERTHAPYFNFLVAGSGPRKGADIARKAFQAVFGRFNGDGPIPRLVIKDPRGREAAGPDVDIVTGYLTPEEEVELYAQAHCYLGVSRGEGWGMQPLQAMAQGCPTILSDAHGHAAFAKYGIPINTSHSKSGYFLFGDAGQWWEPNFDEVCDRMKWVYDNYEFEKDMARRQSDVVRSLFTWDASAQAIINAIGDLDEAIPEGPAEWFEPDVKKFPVVTTRDWKADIAGYRYTFVAGEPQYLPADVKRILFEAGVLDVACVGVDGLTEGQIASRKELADAVR